MHTFEEGGMGGGGWGVPDAYSKDSPKTSRYMSDIRFISANASIFHSLLGMATMSPYDLTFSEIPFRVLEA